MMLSQFVGFSCGALALVGAVTAQATLTVPGSAANQEAISGGMMPGFSARFRQQILVRADQLQAMQGRSITTLLFRRDELSGKTLLQSTADMRVTLSVARRPTTQPSQLFADNCGLNPVTVWNGTVTLPGSVAPPSPIPWTYPWVVRFDFNPSFPYSGGDLCIDVEGTPQSPLPSPNFVWWADYHDEAPVGSVVKVGMPCGAATTQFVSTAGASGTGLVPGSTFAMFSVGWPNTPGVLMLGSALPRELSLDSLGATGCKLRVQPLVQVAVVYPLAASGSTFTALYLDIHLPANPALLGAHFATQWANLELGPRSNPAGLTTTNGVDITLGTPMPAGALSIVRSLEVADNAPLPTVGRVSVARGPVMQFEYSQ